MTIEHARTRAVQKPWGSIDLRPWSEMSAAGAAIGEVWFQRADAKGEAPALLLKLLFTESALSIQVHPDDAFAQAIGLPNGKTEAWYILAAKPGAAIATGLKRQVTPAELRAAIDDGSIAELVQWREVVKDEVIFVPAGTIHAIGGGLVVAEIQQSSDVTFRLFDHGRARELHVDQAVGAAQAGPARTQSASRRLGDARTVLVAGPHFVLERIELAARSTWQLQAERETWMLVIAGQARIGLNDATVGEVLFLEADSAGIEVGGEGFKGLLAYVGGKPYTDLLQPLDMAGRPGSTPESWPLPLQYPTTLRSPVSRMELLA